MMKMLLALAVLGAMPLAAAADVTKEDVKKLAAAGVSESVILSYIRANGPVTKLSADDLVDLKQAGASDAVLGALIGGSPGAPSPGANASSASSHGHAGRKAETTYVPQTTHVYETPRHYYYSDAWCGYSYSYPRYSFYYSRPRYGFYYGGGGWGGCW